MSSITLSPVFASDLSVLGVQPLRPEHAVHSACRTGAVAFIEPAQHASGDWRVVWASRFGPVLIEVRDGTIFVNGQRVEPVSPTPRPLA